MDKYIKPSEAARILSVSRQLVYRWIKEGKIEGYRIGGKPLRIREADLETLITRANTGGDEDEG